MPVLVGRWKKNLPPDVVERMIRIFREDEDLMIGQLAKRFCISYDSCLKQLAKAGVIEKAGSRWTRITDVNKKMDTAQATS